MILRIIAYLTYKINSYVTLHLKIMNLVTVLKNIVIENNYVL